MNSEKTKWQELDDTLTQLKKECDQLNTQLTEFSAGVPGLQDEYNELERFVTFLLLFSVVGYFGFVAQILLLECN